MTHQLDSKNTSKCCNAPTVICEGTEWDVKDVRGGSTYYYGCTKCKEACDIVQPPNTEDVIELDDILVELEISVGDLYSEFHEEEIREKFHTAKSKLTKYIKQQVLIGRKAELERAVRVYRRGNHYDSGIRERITELDRKISELKGKNAP